MMIFGRKIMIVVFVILVDLDVVEVFWFLVFCLDDY